MWMSLWANYNYSCSMGHPFPNQERYEKIEKNLAVNGFLEVTKVQLWPDCEYVPPHWWDCHFSKFRSVNKHFPTDIFRLPVFRILFDQRNPILNLGYPTVPEHNDWLVSDNLRTNRATLLHRRRRSNRRQGRNRSSQARTNRRLGRFNVCDDDNQRARTLYRWNVREHDDR